MAAAFSAVVVALTVWGVAPAAAATFTVSGEVSTPAGAIQNGSVNFYRDSSSVSVPLGAGGAYSAQLPEGSYRMTTNVTTTEVDGTTARLSLNKYIGVTANTVVDLVLPARRLTVMVKDQDGEPVTASVGLNCYERQASAGSYTGYSSNSGIGPLSVWGFPVDNPDRSQFEGCQLSVTRELGYPKTINVDISGTEDNTLTVVRPDTNRISGTISVTDDLSDPYLTNAYNMDDPTEEVVIGNGSSPTEYFFDLVPARYALMFSFVDFRDTGVQGSRWVLGVDASSPQDLDVELRSEPLVLNVVDAEGRPLDGLQFGFHCSRDLDFVYSEGIRATDDLITLGKVGEVGVRKPPADELATGWACKLGYETEESSYRLIPIPDVTSDEITVVLPSGAVFDGAPDVPADSDGVSNLVEAQAPNGGDGNHDGVSDAEQTHVTSLPANGAEYAAGVPYVTVAGSAGSTLSDVSTTDPSTLETEPPVGTTLVGGLVAFKLDVADGATETVSVYAGDASGVNGYAKYDPVTEEWSMLPAERVQVHDLAGTAEDHVDVTLTDGGVGDADGVADGTITDPGGYAKTVQGDTTPPVVTGTPTRSPNGNGWYRGNVTIDWSATDAGGEVASPPADTVVSTQGADVTGQSPEVCDNAPTPNCARGTVTGLKIDKTDPSLSVTGVSNGATYVLGAVPSVGCAASDALSGLAGPCKGLLVGGNANKVGRFVYGATATDKAGNNRVAAAAYEVAYRFDGFVQPVNDPALTPGAPVSVFKAGSVVPLAFSVKKANGQVVTPTSKPVWLGPVKGARTSAAVNESVVNGSGTSGSSYVWKNNRWQFDWSTKGLAAGYLYKVGVKLDDGTTHYVTVGLR